MFKNLFKTLFLLFIMVYLSSLGSGIPKDMRDQTSINRPIDSGISQNDIYFIPNQGQVDQQALFYSHTPRYTLWLTRNGLIFDQIEKNPAVKKGDKDILLREKSSSSLEKNRHVSRLIFHGSNPNPKLLPLHSFDQRVNYFMGRDESRWKADIPTWGAVIYENLYNHIDLKVYSHRGQIEYDWIIKSGGLVSDIQFEYRDVDSAGLDSKGNLIVQTSFGEFIHARPSAFQNIKGEKVEITAAFIRKSKNIFFLETGSYDPDRILIIDPLVYSTYIGGSDSDYGMVVTTDSKGAVYIAGDTYSLDFPIKNPFQKRRQGYRSIFIMKLKRTGKKIVYSTFLGGRALDYAKGIAVDSNGNVYVAGFTGSEDFPVKKAYQREKNGNEGDLFVTKFGPKGNTLIYSTYLGGSGYEDLSDIAINKKGSAYVVGFTESMDFPMHKPIKGKKDGYRDGFVTKFHPNGKKLIYSTHLGGEDLDRAIGVAVDSKGSAYVVGDTKSLDFPTKNPFQANMTGFTNGFVCKIDAKGKKLIYSTYLGGTCNSHVHGVAVDAKGYAYVAGQTSCYDFPIKIPFQDGLKGIQDGFVTKFSREGNTLVYSTFLGGNDSELGYGIAIDDKGCAWITGVTSSKDFPLKNAFYDKNTDKYNAFISKLNPDGDTLAMSSYIGGNKRDRAFRLAVDRKGCAYVVGDTESTNLLTKNALQSEIKGKEDAFLVKIK